MPEINVTVWDESTAGERVVFVHGSTTWGESAFARQRPLAADFRLELVDRRGYGGSPDVDHSDATVDAEDLLEVVGGGPVTSSATRSGRSSRCSRRAPPPGRSGR